MKDNRENQPNLEPGSLKILIKLTPIRFRKEKTQINNTSMKHKNTGDIYKDDRYKSIRTLNINGLNIQIKRQQMSL